MEQVISASLPLSYHILAVFRSGALTLPFFKPPSSKYGGHPRYPSFSLCHADSAPEEQREEGKRKPE